MGVVSASSLLDLWQEAYSKSPLERSFVFLAAACPASREQLSLFSIGERNVLLFRFRATIFGPHLTCLTCCPVCRERLETVLDINQMMDVYESITTLERQEAKSDDTVMETTIDDYRIKFRTLMCCDLVDVSGIPETDRQQFLFNRCIISILYQGKKISTEKVPSEVKRQLIEKIEAADPLGNVQLSWHCPHCANEWVTPLDIVSFLWNEFDAWAIKTLQEVHTLASFYGWNKATILTMNPWRRKYYLNMVGGEANG